MVDDKDLVDATAPLSFAEFLERMKDPAAADLVRSIKNFIKTFNDRKPEPERDSQQVQQFLAKSEGAFRQHPVWAKGLSEHQAQAIEGLEKYLMTKIYHKTFAASVLDRERDEALNARMTALNFIKPQHLDIPPVFQDDKAWLLAMKELHKINSYKAPRDKLVCILNCCRIINNLLHVTVQSGEARGADDFLPILIYVVIHANPPQLASNLEYIQRFRMQSKMVSESSYFFTQLNESDVQYSAATFIETISSNSLTMDTDEFVARMMAAGVPDMQLLPQETDRKPTGASAHIPAEKPISITPPAEDSALSPGHASLQAEKVNLGSRGSSRGWMYSSKAGSRGSLPSVATLEQAGVQHVLDAEASGDLQSRHPFVYALAADLRVADVEALLAAYKQLVLRYEALSLSLGHYSASSDGLSNPTTPGDKLHYGDPPPVDGPNPFAPGRYTSGSELGNTSAKLTDGQQSSSGQRPSCSGVEAEQALLAEEAGALSKQLAAYEEPRLAGENVSTSGLLQAPPGCLPSLSTSMPVTAAAVLGDMLRSASLTVPATPPVTNLEPVLAPLQPGFGHQQFVPPPASGVATAIAAAAIDSATAAVAGSRGNSLDIPRSHSGILAEPQVFPRVAEEAPLEQPAAIPEESSLEGSRPSSAAPVRTEQPSPAPASEPPSSAQQAAELPELQLPDPFQAGGEVSAVRSSIGTPEQQSPFEQASWSFAAPSSGGEGPGCLPSRASAPQVTSEGSVILKPSGLETPFVSSSSPWRKAEGKKDSAATSSGVEAERLQSAPMAGETKGRILTGFASSPFAASANMIFRDSPPRDEPSEELKEEKSTSTQQTPQDSLI